MSALVEELLLEIRAAGLVAEVTGDRRGEMPGGPVSVEVVEPNRGDEEKTRRKHYASLLVRTLPPINDPGAPPSLYHVTDVTVDSAASFRTRGVMTAAALWGQIAELRRRQREAACRVCRAESQPPPPAAALVEETPARVAPADAPVAGADMKSGGRRRRRRRGRRGGSQVREAARQSGRQKLAA